MENLLPHPNENKEGNRDRPFPFKLILAGRHPRFPSWPPAPGRWWWFLSHPIDWSLFQQSHGLGYGAFELRITSADHFPGPVFDVDVGRDPFIFYRPLAVACEES